MKTGQHEMHLRAATHHDIQHLDAIALQAKAHWGYPPALLETWRASLLTAPSSIGTWPTFVAEESGRAIGFAQVNPECHPWELVSLWVLPEHMGQGVGRSLLAQVAQAARGANQCAVHIDSDPNAEAFYVACGAVVVGAVPAPIPGDPSRVRPQLRLMVGPAATAGCGDGQPP